ncbi:MAG: hydroxyacid dehydrogenase [Acidobacteria bacterium RIFCSPLOWO2_12_FULL_54_10]|nr:MAG: hydroxyacid dehydrogenase [Acidobacteria bacterium RIFCSPLOWO2_12_FULL_54_10]
MQISILEVNDWEIPFLKENLPAHQVTFSNCKIHEVDPKTISETELLSVFIYSRVDRQTINLMPRLRWIATRSTGFDHIDLEACKDRGIQVANVPNYGENTVAEHTFALILSLSRHIHKSYVRVTSGNFSREGLSGFDLKGKTIGVIGVGRIGLHVIKIARGFGMQVLATDVRQDSFLAELMGFQYVSLEDLLAQSDIVTLHLPYLKSTHHFLDARRIAIMRQGALLINTARGGLVDTDALLAALNSGKLAGAGLDVLEGEHYISEEQEMLRSEQPVEVLRGIVRDHVLLRHENVVFTPHNAFNSREATQRILETTMNNIRGFLSNAPVNLVA